MPHTTYVCVANSSDIQRGRFAMTHANGAIPRLHLACLQFISHAPQMSASRPDVLSTTQIQHFSRPSSTNQARS